jgi:hypothetical protein
MTAISSCTVLLNPVIALPSISFALHCMYLNSRLTFFFSFWGYFTMLLVARHHV